MELWLNIFWGALAGYLLPYLVPAISFLIRLTRRRFPEGSWHLFHHTRDEKGQWAVHRDRLQIKKRYGGGLAVDLYKPQEGNPKMLWAKGRLHQEENFWIFDLKATTYDEWFLIRMEAPVPTHVVTASGLWLGKDYCGRTISSSALITNQEIDTKAASDIMRQTTKVDTEQRSLLI
jgi:hypothetical protein